MSARTMRLTFHASIGSLRFRRYHHARRGLVETLAYGNVVYVRPCFGSTSFTQSKPKSKRKTKLRRDSNAQSGR